MFIPRGIVIPLFLKNQGIIPLFHCKMAIIPLFRLTKFVLFLFRYSSSSPDTSQKDLYPFCYGTCTTHVGTRFQLFSPGQRDRKPLQVWKCQFACTRWQCLARRSASRYKLNTVCKNVTSIRHWRPNKVKQHCEEHVPTCDHFCWVFKRQKKKKNLSQSLRKFQLDQSEGKSSQVLA